MSRKNVFAIAILVGLAFAVAACEFSFSTANIANAYMAADAAGSQPTTVFSQDAVFYAIVDLANAPADTTVNMVWIAVDVEGEEPNLVIDEVPITSGDARLTFDLANAPNTLWPLGQYRADIYLNDKLDTSLEFEVQ